MEAETWVGYLFCWFVGNTICLVFWSASSSVLLWVISKVETFTGDSPKSYVHDHRLVRRRWRQVHFILTLLTQVIAR